jgi:signal transduction histidine kinase
LTQGDTRGVILEKERIDLGGLCRAAVEAFRPRAEEKQQTLDVAIEPSTGTAIGDARRLRESVEHILRNAVSFTEEGGHIRLHAAGSEPQATITITDDGPGIPTEDQGQVFARFHRSTGQGGSDAALGLGLPLTRQFVEAHGGQVELVSAPGKGTSVTITIPRAPK